MVHVATGELGGVERMEVPGTTEGTASQMKSRAGGKAWRQKPPKNVSSSSVVVQGMRLPPPRMPGSLPGPACSARVTVGPLQPSSHTAVSSLCCEDSTS